MSLYKAFFKIIKKNLVPIMIYFGITIGVLIMLSGIFGSKTTKKAELDSYNIYVENKDDSDYARAVVGFLNSIHKVREDELAEEQIKDLMYYEQIVCYIEIPKGFGETFASTGENKITNTYDDAMPVGMAVSLQINNYLNAVRDYTEQGYSIAEASQKTTESLDITKYVTIHSGDVQVNGKMKGTFNYLPYGILAVLITGLFPAVVAFNKGEKRNRMQVSSMSAGKRNTWILLGSATFALMILVILVIVATVMGSSDASGGVVPGNSASQNSGAASGVLFTETWWLSVANAVVFTIVVAMMISMFANIPAFASAPAGAFSNIVGLGFCFLGGTFVPLEIMGDGVTKFSRFLPNYWYTTAVNRIYSGGTLSDIWDCFLIQLSFGLVCLFVGLAVAKITAEKKEIA